MARSTQGPIPDDHHENEPLPSTKPIVLSAAMQDHIAALKKEQAEDEATEGVATRITIFRDATL